MEKKRANDYYTLYVLSALVFIIVRVTCVCISVLNEEVKTESSPILPD